MQDDREAVFPHLSGLARRKKGRKRARSSSPTSSPMSKTDSPVVNIKKLAQALKSPHPDPTLDLWDRYTLGGVGGATDSQDGSGMGLHDLFATGSPRPAGRTAGVTPQAESSLRRAVPSSRLHFNKRRKLEPEEETPTDAGRGGASKYSLVTSLLDSVTSSMQEPQGNQGSSPLLNKENARQGSPRGSAGSPSPRKRTRASPPSSPPCSIQPRNERAGSEAADIAPKPTGLPISTDEFGDDDFDDELFMDIDAQVGATTAQAAPDTMKPAERPQPRKSPRKSPRKNVYPPPRAMPPAQAASAAAAEDVDFDDDDLDDDALMELADQAAPANSSIPAPLGSGPRTKQTDAPAAADASLLVEDDMDEDDFGDDADWDAVELAATQAAPSQPPRSQYAPRTSGGSSSIPVRHHGRPEGFV